MPLPRRTQDTRSKTTRVQEFLQRRWQGKVVRMFAVIFFFAFTYYVIDVVTDEDQFNGIAHDKDTFLAYLYYATTTQSTCGYGDITPRTTFARVAAMLQMFSLVGVWFG